MTSKQNEAQLPTPGASRPWWRVGTMWLVVGGPLTVVVASFATLGLALSHPDPVLESSSHVEAQGADEAGGQQAQMPAMRARNHAATGGR